MRLLLLIHLIIKLKASDSLKAEVPTPNGNNFAGVLNKSLQLLAHYFDKLNKFL